MAETESAPTPKAPWSWSAGRGRLRSWLGAVRQRLPWSPAPVRGHWGYVCLFELALLAALWQHAHPYLTLVLAVAAPALAIVTRMPPHHLGPAARGLAQNLIGLSSVAWMAVRLLRQAPVDVLLVEGFSVMGLALFLSTRLKEYGSLLVISTIMLGYASILPARGIYFAILGPAFGIGLYLLYCSRAAHLANNPRLSVRPHPLRWRSLAVHLALVLCLWYIAARTFPSGVDAAASIVSAAFRRRSVLPPRLRDWLASPWRRAQVGGEVRQQRPPSGEGPSVNAWGQPRTTLGRDLVMRVRSPVKLYWLAQLYDRYDGRKWTASTTMRQQSAAAIALKGMAQPARTVEQQVSIEKWISRSLYGAYLPLHLTPLTTDDVPGTSTFYGTRLAEDSPLPPTPFSYRVLSLVAYEPDADGPLDVWHERIPPRHYLDLPVGIVSLRLEALAAGLTAEAKTPLAKAYALRSYLRQFPYTLATRPPPPDREAVDYFVFELKTGHCEYYAAALAVMARLAGLPARVATGFAPGNFNAMSGVFEVYEYHAHAWTQIFIPDKGWLTMDATPAGAVQLQPARQKALAMGPWRDPFSNEWRIRTPELSSDIAERTLAPEEMKDVGESSSVLTLIASKIPTTRQGWRDLLASLTGQAEPPPENEAAPAAADSPLVAMAHAMTANLNAARDLLWRRLTGALGRVRAVHIVAMIIAGLAALAIMIFYPSVRAQVSQSLRLRQCDQWLRRAAQTRQRDPGASVRYCYLALSEMLEVAGRGKRVGEDLTTYAASLEDIDASLAANVAEVFNIYSRGRYSLASPGRDDSELAWTRTRRATDLLIAMLKG